ncbi:MAG: PilZ domain-containing protein [Thiobacillaceae bacterium]
MLRNPRAPRFRVTPKGEVHYRDFVSSLAKPFYAFYMLAWVSLGFGVWRWFDQPLTRDVTLITMGWEVFNLLLLHGVLGAMYERRQRRGAPRVPAQEAVRLVGTLGRPLDARILDISASGMQLGFDAAATPPEGRLHVEVTPAALGREVRLPVSIAWQRKGALGLYFEPEDVAQKREIIALAYGDSERWRDMQARRRTEADRLGVVQAFARLMAIGSRAAFDLFTALLARFPEWIDRRLDALVRPQAPAATQAQNTPPLRGLPVAMPATTPAAPKVTQTSELV